MLIGIAVLVGWGLKEIGKSASSSDSKNVLALNPATKQSLKLDLPTQPQAAETFTITDKGAAGIQVQGDAKTDFKVTLPNSLGSQITIELSGGRTIGIAQKNGADFQKISKDKITKTAENEKLLAIIQKDSNLAVYQDAGSNLAFYNFQKIQGEKKQSLFKNWTLFNAPPTSSNKEAKPPRGGLASEGVITQAYTLSNAIVNLDASGNANIFFDDGKDVTNRDPAFTIPKPYFLDKDGNKTDLVWKFEQATKILSTSFTAKAEMFPIALDPSILKTDKVIATFSGKKISMIATCGQSFICGNNCLYNSVTYGTVLIGTQCWMSENLRTDKYPDGTAITRGPATSGGLWTGADLGFYAYPPNSANNAEADLTTDIIPNKLGFVYQWSAAMEGSIVEGVQGICPSGWHVPTHNEYTTMERAICTSGTCATDFPFDTSTTGWRGTNEGSKLSLETSGGNNSSGFTGKLAGYRNTTGTFGSRASYVFFWSSSQSSSSYAWSRYLSSGYATVGRGTVSESVGFSVRCLKN